MVTESDTRRRELAAEITERLTRVRGSMTDEEFAQLVESMARTSERFLEIDMRRSAHVPRGLGDQPARPD
jgi:hypothetical protein